MSQQMPINHDATTFIAVMREVFRERRPMVMGVARRNNCLGIGPSYRRGTYSDRHAIKLSLSILNGQPSTFTVGNKGYLFDILKRAIINYEREQKYDPDPYDILMEQRATEAQAA